MWNLVQLLICVDWFKHSCCEHHQYSRSALSVMPLRVLSTVGRGNHHGPHYLTSLNPTPDHHPPLFAQQFACSTSNAHICSFHARWHFWQSYEALFTGASCSAVEWTQTHHLNRLLDHLTSDAWTTTREQCLVCGRHANSVSIPRCILNRFGSTLLSPKAIFLIKMFTLYNRLYNEFGSNIFHTFIGFGCGIYRVFIFVPNLKRIHAVVMMLWPFQ